MRLRGDVEGLRAVAVLLVVADHVLGRPRGGFVGVDVFFVLSGFLITGLLVQEAERTGTVRLRAFWARRARRLLPAGLVVLAATSVAAQLVFLPDRAAQTALDAVFAAASVANWRSAALGTDYFSSTRPPSPVQHYWSLAVEEQFYALWPLVLVLLAWAVRRRTRSAATVRQLATVAAGLVLVASLAWSVRTSTVSPTTAYFSTATRAYELAAGALLALQAGAVARLPARVAGLLAGAGLVGIAASAVVVGPTTAFPGAAALLPVLSTVAVLAAGSAGTLTAAGRLLSGRLPRHVGRVSYSLYLWHWPVLVLGTALRPDRPGWLLVLLLVVSAGLAEASYRWVEQPLRRARPAAPRSAAPPRQVRARPRLGAVLAAALLVVVGSAVSTSRAAETPAGSGVAAPADRTAVPAPPADAYPAVPALRSAVADGLRASGLDHLDPPLATLVDDGAPEWVSDSCLDVTVAKEAACTYGPVSAPHQAVLLGDSVSISYLPGLRAALEPAGYRLHVLTRRQCALGAPDDAVTVGCREHRAHVVQAVAQVRPDLVLLAGSYTAADRRLVPADAPGWQARMGALLARLRAPGRRVVVLAAPPQTGNLQSCATRLGSARDCVVPVRPAWTALAAAERSAAKAEGARFVDTGGWFCSGGRCPATVDGTPVAFDGTHLTAVHSRRLALVLRDAVTRDVRS